MDEANLDESLMACSFGMKNTLKIHPNDLAIFDKIRGKSEQRTEPYLRYGKGADATFNEVARKNSKSHHKMDEVSFRLVLGKVESHTFPMACSFEMKFKENPGSMNEVSFRLVLGKVEARKGAVLKVR